MRDRKLSPPELVASLLRRSAALDPQLQAWVDAFLAAKEIEARAALGDDVGLLGGVPVSWERMNQSWMERSSRSQWPLPSTVYQNTCPTLANAKAGGSPRGAVADSRLRTGADIPMTAGVAFAALREASARLPRLGTVAPGSPR